MMPGEEIKEQRLIVLILRKFFGNTVETGRKDSPSTSPQ